jgi:hypothetical protein
VKARLVSEFTKHVVALCARREIDIQKISDLVEVDLTQLLRMINGKTVPTEAVIAGLAKVLDCDVCQLRQSAGGISQIDRCSEADDPGHCLREGGSSL